MQGRTGGGGVCILGLQKKAQVGQHVALAAAAGTDTSAVECSFHEVIVRALNVEKTFSIIASSLDMA